MACSQERRMRWLMERRSAIGGGGGQSHRCRERRKPSIVPRVIQGGAGQGGDHHGSPTGASRVVCTDNESQGRRYLLNGNTSYCC